MKIVCELHHICPHYSKESTDKVICLIDAPHLVKFGSTSAECKIIGKVNNYKEYTFKEQMKRALYETKKDKNRKGT